MITAEQVEAAVKAAGIIYIEHHECSGCGFMTHYSVENGQLFFHPGCDCGRMCLPEPRAWSSASEWINMQSREDNRKKLMRKFGLKVEV